MATPVHPYFNFLMDNNDIHEYYLLETFRLELNSGNEIYFFMYTFI